jgi:hypothetical protein
MSIALVAHVPINQSVASSNIDTTGASLLVAAISSNSPPNTIVDSKGNTWVGLTTRDTGTRNNVRLLYAWKPIVGTAHNFTPAANAGSTVVAAFSGLEKMFDPFIMENGGITAAADVGASAGLIYNIEGRDTLIVTAFGIDDPAGNTMGCTGGRGFSIIDTIDVIVGSQYGISMAFGVLKAGGTVNPAWTRSTTNAQAGDAFADAAFRGLYFPPRWGVSPSVRR